MATTPAKTTTAAKPAPTAPALDVDDLVAKVAAAVLATLPQPAPPPSTIAGVVDTVEFGEPDTPWATGERVVHSVPGERPRHGVIVAVDSWGNPAVAWFESVSDPIHRGDPTLARA